MGVNFGNPLGSSIETGELADGSVTTAKLAEDIKYFTIPTVDFLNTIELSNVGSSISKSINILPSVGWVDVYTGKNIKFNNVIYSFSYGRPFRITDISTQTIYTEDGSNFGTVRVTTEKTNQAYGKTTTPSTDTQSVDGDLTTSTPTYSSTGQPPAQIEVHRVDLGSIMTINRLYLKIGAWTDVSWNSSIVNWEYSTDGSTWTNIGDIINTNSQSEIVTEGVADINTSVRYIRVRVRGTGNLGTANSYCKVYEIFAWG